MVRTSPTKLGIVVLLTLPALPSSLLAQDCERLAAQPQAQIGNAQNGKSSPTPSTDCTPAASTTQRRQGNEPAQDSSTDAATKPAQRRSIRVDPR